MKHHACELEDLRGVNITKYRVLFMTGYSLVSSSLLGMRLFEFGGGYGNNPDTQLQLFC